LSIEVRIAKVPGLLKSVVVADGSTVGQALATAEMSVDSGSLLQLDGSNTTMDANVRDGSRITISKGAKGNS